MRKHINPADLHPKAGDRITLTLTHVVQVPNPAPSANPPRPGKLNYLSKPKKPIAKPTQLGSVDVLPVVKLAALGNVNVSSLRA